MLASRGQLLSEINQQHVVSLRETERRDKIIKEERDRFLRQRGITPVDEDADNVDEDALEAQQKVIERIQAEEAARILADVVSEERGGDRPRAAMRD